MKFSSFSRLFSAGIFVWLLAISAAAQDTGGAFGSYTSIDYDPDTNIVTAYAQTEPDFNLMGDYEGRVWLTVTNEYGVIVASGNGQDNGNGYASVVLSFAGEAGKNLHGDGNSPRLCLSVGLRGILRPSLLQSDVLLLRQLVFHQF